MAEKTDIERLGEIQERSYKLTAMSAHQLLAYIAALLEVVYLEECNSSSAIVHILLDGIAKVEIDNIRPIPVTVANESFEAIPVTLNDEVKAEVTNISPISVEISNVPLEVTRY